MVDVAEASRPRRDGRGDYARGPVDVVGRILLCAIFLFSGLSKLVGWPAVAGMIAGKGIPYPELVAGAAIMVEITGALMVITSIGGRWGALALAAFTLAAGILFHNFWAVPSDLAMNQFNHFMKNVSIVGALLVLAARPR